MSPEARKLAERMSELSEAGYFAGWMNGLEFALWRIANAGGGVYGHVTLDVEVARELLSLAAAANGWIVWNDETEETFVSLTRWLEMYAGSAWLEGAT